MSDSPQRTNLGRGLAAIFGEEDEAFSALEQEQAPKHLPVGQLHPSPGQPRRNFDDTAVRELADSIKENGVLQPILVRPHPNRPGDFEIVAGERRWRAAQLAQLHEVPVVVREIDDGQALELALVENIQREDLNALEEAEAYRHLVEEFGHSQDDLSRALGKSRSHISNTLRLLGLPKPVKALVADGKLSAGHGRALLGGDDPAAMAKAVLAKELNVRQTEDLVRKSRTEAVARRGNRHRGGGREKDPDTLALERDLSALLGLKVSIGPRGEAGSLTIHYRNLDQLDDLLRRLRATSAAT